VKQWIRLFALAAFAFLFIAAYQNQGSGGDTSEVTRVSQSYVEAYNRRDAKALAEHWAEDAVYTNQRTGVVVEGRDAIEEQFKEMFDTQDPSRLNVKVESVSFPTETRAIEKGIATITASTGEPSSSYYKATLEKRNGQWLLTKVSEIDAEEAPSNYENLKNLEWLIGKWVDEDEDSKIETVSNWDKYQNFIVQHFTVNALGKEDLEGRQVIAWDPVNEQIRSWIFDSDGGFGEATWTNKDGNWIVDTVYTLPDGGKATATQIYSNITPNTYTWQSTNREVEGELLPSIDPVTVKKSSNGRVQQ
jgi:uncharacterized protein (TIGR02246 family)